MIGAVVAAVLIAQQPAAPAKPSAPAPKPAVKAQAKPARKGKTQLGRHEEEIKIRALLVGKADRPVTPGEILFVGPPPGESTVVALNPRRGCDQMVDLLMPSPGNRVYAEHDLKGARDRVDRGLPSGLEYAYAYVPFRARAISTAMYAAPVRGATPQPPGGQLPPEPGWTGMDGFMTPLSRNRCIEHSELSDLLYSLDYLVSLNLV
jgi:hypothetical protein